MKTKEFIKRIEELGFEYEKAEEVYFIYDIEGTEYASVCHTTSNQISNTRRAWDWLNKDVQEKLFDLLIEYAKTPIEDREEEKYYLVKFSEKEIEEIKEKFDTDLNDFELVEVVDDKQKILERFNDFSKISIGSDYEAGMQENL